MNLIYNSENYAILAYPVRYGFELVDKQSRRSLFVQGSVAADLRAAFDFLVLMRLQGQVAALRSNATPNNYISLEHLNAMEQGELRLAFEGVAKFQSFIQHHFKLQLLRN